MNTSLYIIVIIVILLLIIIYYYNRLIRKRNFVNNCFADIDVMLKRRFDLLPNLVSIVKKYMEHEKETLKQVTAMRTNLHDAPLSPDDKVKADNQLKSVVDNLFVTLENYPDLKANTVFIELEQSWNETENEISASRRSYNMAVMDYNNAVEMFPSSLIAGIFSFGKRELFIINQEESVNIHFNDEIKK